EGGGQILGQAFDAQLVDKVQFYVAPLLTGGPVFAVAGKGAATTVAGARLHSVRYARIGSDICVTGYPGWSAAAAE
ncbi:MAG: dihydrofolate reductase family protein, partial [Chthoniobacterales bacterium]